MKRMLLLCVLVVLTLTGCTQEVDNAINEIVNDTTRVESIEKETIPSTPSITKIQPEESVINKGIEFLYNDELYTRPNLKNPLTIQLGGEEYNYEEYFYYFPKSFELTPVKDDLNKFNRIIDDSVMYSFKHLKNSSIAYYRMGESTQYIFSLDNLDNFNSIYMSIDIIEKNVVDNLYGYKSILDIINFGYETIESSLGEEVYSNLYTIEKSHVAVIGSNGEHSVAVIHDANGNILIVNLYTDAMNIEDVVSSLEVFQADGYRFIEDSKDVYLNKINMWRY